MSTSYIDEAAGSDATGTGSQDAPYQSLGYALFTHGDSVKYLFRKDATAAYDEPTQSSLKKAKKTADGLEKKKKKAEELAAKEAKDKAEQKEKKEKLLEESKKIVLEEDQSLPKATRVQNGFLILNVILILFDIRPRFLSLLIYVVNVCECLDGYIVDVTRAVSSLSSSVMVLVTCRLYSPVAWYASLANHVTYPTLTT